MALIGIYSDVHISHNSSIIPTYMNDTDYTTRLKMCKDSIIWAYKEFEKRNVNLVVNCGDTFNSHTITSDELSTYVDVINKIYKPYDTWGPTLDITLLGNHDKFNDKFSSIDMIRLTNYSHLVQDYYYCFMDDIDMYFISFYNSDEFINKISEMLKKYPRLCSKSILFMHGDINGSTLSGMKKIENHISKNVLTNDFDIIINGHIHCHEMIFNQDNKQIYNIGSLTTHSFADSNNHYGACYVLDTNTGNIEKIINPYQILFRTYNISSNKDKQNLSDYINYNSNLNMILKIKCPYEYKDSLDELLSKYKNILKYKYIFTYDKKENDDTLIINNKKSVDIKDEFITFLSNRIDLKANVEDYIKVL